MPIDELEEEACYEILGLIPDGQELSNLYTKAEITRYLHRVLYGRDCPASLQEETERVSSLLRCTTALGLETEKTLARGGQEGQGHIRQAMRWGPKAVIYDRNPNAQTLSHIADTCESLADFIVRAAGHGLELNNHHAYGFLKLAGRIAA